MPRTQVRTQLERVRKIALALPGATEKLSHGAPTFFARKVFAMFVDDHHGDGHLAVWLPAPPGLQESAIAEDPRTYFRPPYVGGKGWIGVELPRVKDATLRFHIESAYELVAPPSLKEKPGPKPTPRTRSAPRSSRR